MLPISCHLLVCPFTAFLKLVSMCVIADLVTLFTAFRHCREGSSFCASPCCPCSSAQPTQDMRGSNDAYTYLKVRPSLALIGFAPVGVLAQVGGSGSGDREGRKLTRGSEVPLLLLLGGTQLHCLYRSTSILESLPSTENETLSTL